MKVTIEVEVDDRAADDELVGGMDYGEFETATSFKLTFSSKDLGRLNLALLGNLTAGIIGALAEQNAEFDKHLDRPQYGDLLHETADMMGYLIK